MSTFLFDKIIFGPVESRRLGLSLGINLLLPSAKHCNFDCIYCECGWNESNPGGSFNSATAVKSRLEQKLVDMASEGRLPDYITFAGNGEPTMHPDFAAIIDSTIEIRNRLAPLAKIAVLSNATMIDRAAVVGALNKVDRNILKLDSAIDDTVKLINRPNVFRPIEDTIALLKQFEGQLVIQTMLIRGNYKGIPYDNTTQLEVSALVRAIKEIAPHEVMLYSIARDTPDDGVCKVTREELEKIAEEIRPLGITTFVS